MMTGVFFVAVVADHTRILKLKTVYSADQLDVEYT